MNIHQYHPKEVLSNFDVSVPRGALAYRPEQTAYCVRELGGELTGPNCAEAMISSFRESAPEKIEIFTRLLYMPLSISLLLAAQR